MKIEERVGWCVAAMFLGPASSVTADSRWPNRPLLSSQQQERLTWWAAGGWTSLVICRFFNQTCTGNYTYDQTWSNMIKHDQIWLSMAKGMTFNSQARQGDPRWSVGLAEGKVRRSGPYAVCGEAVVRACVSSKTHYVTWTQKALDSPCQRSVYFEPQITALALEVPFSGFHENAREYF